MAVRVESMAISQSLGKCSRIVGNEDRPHLEPVSSGATHSLAWVRTTIDFDGYFFQWVPISLLLHTFFVADRQVKVPYNKLKDSYYMLVQIII